MLSEYAFESPLGIDVTKLVAVRFPPTVAIDYAYGDEIHSICFTNPLPMSAVTESFDCWQIRITDRNAFGAQLEFGRFNVELWDEDNPTLEFTVDSFEDMAV